MNNGFRSWEQANFDTIKLFEITLHHRFRDRFGECEEVANTHRDGDDNDDIDGWNE